MLINCQQPFISAHLKKCVWDPTDQKIQGWTNFTLAYAFELYLFYDINQY